MGINYIFDFVDKVVCLCLVVKVGLLLLVCFEGVCCVWFEGLVVEIVVVWVCGQDVIVVSLGLIVLGVVWFGLEKGGCGSLVDVQVVVVVGQIVLLGLWVELLGGYGFIVVQFLLMFEDFEDWWCYFNVMVMLICLFEVGVVLVINENDSVVMQEICFGDNDRLVVWVVQVVWVSVVLLLLDIDGFYDCNFKDLGVMLLFEVCGVIVEIYVMVDGGLVLGMGLGGMILKLQVVEIVEWVGIVFVIVSGLYEVLIVCVIEQCIGMLFLFKCGVGVCKVWFGGWLWLKGVLVIDGGVVWVLVGGGSLFVVGIIVVEGVFVCGDVVVICDVQGVMLVYGFVEYGVVECVLFQGYCFSCYVELFGYVLCLVVVYCDQFVVL